MRDDNADNDVGVFEVIEVLWQGKLIIILTTVLALVLAGILYFSVPRTYESTLDIEPVRQADFANFQGLIASELFPYTRQTLFEEFISYLSNTELLIPVALESGVVDSVPGNEALSRRNARLFVQSIDFSRPETGEPMVRMRVRAGNLDALDRFVAMALQRANARFAERIRFEIMQRINAEETRRLAQIAGLEVEIAARRETEESLRQDGIEILRKQAEIARLLDLAKPLEVGSTTEEPQGDGVSVQVSSGNQPAFMQGYLALEEQIRQLETRENADPFVAELRQLQQQVYLLRNDPDMKFQVRLLEESALNDPQNAELVQYDIVRAAARKVFPSVTVFAPTAFVLGLLIGVSIVLWRAHGRADDRAKPV